MKKILITGGAGFVGSHLAESLLASGYEVSIFDDFSTGKIENLKKIKDKIKIIKGDIRDIKKVSNACKGIDVILHHAAQIFVPVSMENPVETMDVNAKGTLNVLMGAEKNGVKKVILASSSAVYGDTTKIPIKESTPIKPLSPYGISKAISEYYCQVFSRMSGIDTFVFRYFNIFGSRQNPHSPYSGVVSKFIDLSKKNSQLLIYGDGKQTRDFIPVDKIVEANLLAIKSNLKGSHVFNIGGGKTITVNLLAELIKDISKSKSSIKHIASREGDIVHSCAFIKKAESELKWSGKYDIRKEISKIIK